MQEITNFLSEHILGMAYAAGAAIVVWISANMIGKPLLDYLSDRRAVLEIINRDGFVGMTASQERIESAEVSIREASSKMAFYAQSSPFIVKLYSLAFLHFHSDVPGLLNGLHNMVGANIQNLREEQRNYVDAILLHLGATNKLTKARKKELRKKLKQTDR